MWLTVPKQEQFNETSKYYIMKLVDKNALISNNKHSPKTRVVDSKLLCQVKTEYVTYIDF